MGGGGEGGNCEGTLGLFKALSLNPLAALMESLGLLGAGTHVVPKAQQLSKQALHASTTQRL